MKISNQILLGKNNTLWLPILLNKKTRFKLTIETLKQCKICSKLTIKTTGVVLVSLC